jgi:hypothetical protein
VDEVSFRGGSGVGWVNAGFPLARLTCSRQRLTLAGLGTCEFTPEQVVSFGTHGSIPFLANGLSIEHNRLDYPAHVVFWCMGSRDRVREEIRRIGFVPTGVAVERPRGMPFRWGLVIVLLLVWTLPFLLGPAGFMWIQGPPMPGQEFVPGLGIVFVLATAIKLSARAQRLALAPGHSVVEVRELLSLLQFVSGLLAVPLGLVGWLGGS